MPLVRIDLAQGRPPDYARAIADVIYESMRTTMNVPENDRFMIVTEHPQAHMIVDPTYLGVQRTKACVIVAVTLNEGRTVEQKKAFYRAVAEGVHTAVGLRMEDVFISLTEVKKENWSFGNGEAQYAT
jgi:phenylpyruvate tautomerase PptA (4-oxalocrotonate tautomerase family)